MRESDLIHFATHGEPDAVYLSGETEDDIRLSMAEVQMLKLPRTSLVVLSECDSFKGKLSTDGVLGITRAFVAAGGPTLVALWCAVSDDATKVLVRYF